MARAEPAWQGFVVTLTHDEVQYALYAAEGGQWLGGVAGGAVSLVATPAIGALVTTAVTGYFSLQKDQIGRADKGNGIYLTLPWPAIYYGQYWLIIVGSVAVLPESGWGKADSGELRDDDNDVIRFQVQHGAIGTDAVEFILTTERQLWKKQLILDDGMGGRWTLETDGSKTRDVNGLYLNQLPTGHLEFWKAKAFGVMWKRIEVPIAHLRGGERVTFAWITD
ncbi:hypothetical protein [Nitrospira sp. Nam74]